MRHDPTGPTGTPPDGNDADGASGGYDSSAAGGGYDGSAAQDNNDGSDRLVAVPDDARELDRDVEAWRREQRWERRRLFFEKAMRGTDRPGRRRVGVPVPLIAIAVVCVALVGTTITMLSTRPATPPTPPVALELAAPSVAVGQPGGLLPQDRLLAENGETTSRDLRPGVVAIVGPNCDCERALAGLTHEAATSALPVYVVGAPEQTAQVERLVSRSSWIDAHSLVDIGGALIQAYQPHGLTVIPVHADGVTGKTVRDYTASQPLGPVLVSLRQPGPR